jgi:DNA-binding NtrC family response regulator
MPPSLKPNGNSASLKPTARSTSVKPAGNGPSLKPAGKPKILLIDDDRILMERTAVYLKAKGFLVTTSENVFTIASTIGSERPDAIVLDVRMPALGGDKVASVLSRLCTLPIVFYSAVDDEDGEALAAAHENARFVSKGSGLRCLWELLVEITGSGTPAVGL